jgi:cobyrinic acid a,c-diamide synthase
MVGALPCEIEMTGKPQGHGYVVAKVDNENPFFAPGAVLRGHEFHNSRLKEVRRIASPLGTMFSGDDSSESQTHLNGFNSTGRCDTMPEGYVLTAYHLSRGKGLGDNRDGIVYRNVLAAYTHLHVGGAPDWAQGLVDRAQIYREARQRVKP